MVLFPAKLGAQGLAPLESLLGRLLNNSNGFVVWSGNLFTAQNKIVLGVVCHPTVLEFKPVFSHYYKENKLFDKKSIE